MITKKRDQRQYDLVQQYLPGLILNTILGIIRELGDPYNAKPGLGGMTAYPPMAMAAVCIMLEAERTTYRKMVGMLRNNHAMATKMGLTKIPSKSTIARSYGLIPEWYLVHVHQTVIREVEAGSLAGDSTGFSYPRFVRWFDVRADKFRTKKGWVKMHAIVDIRTRVIIDYLVTDSVTADINGLYVMLHRLGLGMGMFCLDSAYLAREMCDMISTMSHMSTMSSFNRIMYLVWFLSELAGARTVLSCRIYWKIYRNSSACPPRLLPSIPSSLITLVKNALLK